jgi:hypothetical protein
MISDIHRPFRYDFFTIWGNGLSHAEAILDILRGEENLEIMRIESRKVKDMKSFVFGLYACDPVPLEHLRSKLCYLFKERPEVIIVLVKNLAPEEGYFGEGSFRHLQCAYINRIKQQIRDLFNPRIDGVRTEDHVIHASDYEEQVDYMLKMLGYSEGIRYLDDDDWGLPFRKPYHIPRPKIYTFKTLQIRDLRASILVDLGPRGIKTELVEIHRTPHFRAFRDGGKAYADYIKRFRYTLLTDDQSLEKLLQMNGLSISEIKAFDQILVRPVACGFQILDGVHRAAVALNHQLKSIRCVKI